MYNSKYIIKSNYLIDVSNNMKILSSKEAKLEQDVEVSYENAQVTTEAYGYVIYSAK